MARPEPRIVKPTAKKPVQRAPQQTSLFGGILAAAGVGKGPLRELRGFHPKNLRRGLRSSRQAARGLQARTAAKPIKTIPKTGALRTRQAPRQRPRP